MPISLLLAANFLTSTPFLPVEPESSGLPRELGSYALEPFAEPFAYEDENDTEDDWFLRVSGGLVTSQESDGPDEDIEFDEGYLVSAGVGHRFGASDTGLGFGLELDGVWTDQDTDDDDSGIEAVTDVTVLAALLNGLLDFRIAERFTIYAGPGIGVSWLDVGTESDALNDFDEEDGPFLAWQAKAGLAWGFSSNVALHVGYRFLNIDDAEIDDDLGDASFDLETQQHVLEAGLIFGL